MKMSPLENNATQDEKTNQFLYYNGKDVPPTTRPRVGSHAPRYSWKWGGSLTRDPCLSIIHNVIAALLTRLHDTANNTPNRLQSLPYELFCGSHQAIRITISRTSRYKSKRLQLYLMREGEANAKQPSPVPARAMHIQSIPMCKSTMMGSSRRSGYSLAHQGRARATTMPTLCPTTRPRKP